MNDYIELMQKAIGLALKGKGFTSPNPIVGCLIYDEESKEIVGEGFHVFSGGPHAEVNAIQDAILNIGSVKGKTLITTLEPCCHRGKKTPPCTDLIINSKIKKVIIGTLDPNKLVSANGIKTLETNGVDVVAGVLESDCKVINEIYNYNTINKQPFVSMKVASSIDGKIALSNGESKYITSAASRAVVHDLRFFNDAILVGLGTVIKDDPRLDVRLGKYKDLRKDRKIIVYGRVLDFKYHDFHIFKEPENIIFINYGEKVSSENYPFEIISHCGDWKKTFTEVYNRGVNSVLVEPGKKLFKDLVTSNAVNKFYFHQSPSIIGSGISFSDEITISELNDRIFLKPAGLKKVGDEIHYEAYL